MVLSHKFFPWLSVVSTVLHLNCGCFSDDTRLTYIVLLCFVKTKLLPSIYGQCWWGVGQETYDHRILKSREKSVVQRFAKAEISLLIRKFSYVEVPLETKKKTKEERAEAFLFLLINIYASRKKTALNPFAHLVPWNSEHLHDFNCTIRRAIIFAQTTAHSFTRAVALLPYVAPG